MIKFIIPGDPPRVTAQQKRMVVKNGQPRFYPSDAMKAAQNFYLNGAWPFKPPRPITGAVSLFITFAFSTKDKKLWHKPKTTRPDCSNMVKILEDILTGVGFWNDDAQISHLVITKEWAEEGSTTITIVDIGKARREAELMAAKINAGANK